MGCNGIGLARSADGGHHFGSPIDPPGASKSSWDPALAVAPNGTVYAAFMITRGRATRIRWSPRRSITVPRSLGLRRSSLQSDAIGEIATHRCRSRRSRLRHVGLLTQRKLSQYISIPAGSGAKFQPATSMSSSRNRPTEAKPGADHPGEPWVSRQWRRPCTAGDRG